MKSFCLKRIGIIIAAIVIAVLFCGCNAGENRTISNIGKTGQVAMAETTVAEGSLKEAPPSEPGNGEEGSANTVPESGSTGKETGPPAEKPEPSADQTKKEEEKKSVPTREDAETAGSGQTGASGDIPEGNSLYTGYKGPVQGEIKYQEGRPATQNSMEYKASGDIGSPYHIDLIVTRDYGHKKIYAENVGLVKDEVGMEVMFRNLDIQTAYGGGFVNTINGLESGYTFFTGDERKKLDWFYWVNGILAPVGVAEYRPQPGDVLWWDYHDWSMTMFLPAVIGSYPQPFKSGYGGKNPGTVIMYTEEYREYVEKLKQSLVDQGVKQVDTAAYDPQVIQAPKKYYILLGLWDKLSADNDYLRDINTRNKLAGVYAKFEDGKLQALNFKGKVISSHEHAGAIYAYGASIGSMNPIWMVTGTDDQGYKMAIDTLLNNPRGTYGHFQAAITVEGVINLPYEE